MTGQGVKVRLLRRNCRGSVLVEMVASVLLMFAIFFGIASLGSSIIYMQKDLHAARAGLDMAVLADQGRSQPQEDFDLFGQRMGEIMSIDSGESFRIIFTAIEFDHEGAGLSVGWQRAYGSATGVDSKISIGGGQVDIEGIDLTVADDERMVVVEIFRSRRGLFPGSSPDYYTRAMVYQSDPDHA